MVRQRSVMPTADLPQGDKTYMMDNCEYFVYILKSVNHNRIYIGSTQNVEVRMNRHNSGKVTSTKPYSPWILLEVYTYDTRGEAMKAEQHFKTGQQRELIKLRNDL